LEPEYCPEAGCWNLEFHLTLITDY
jgi:hypothetical protein